MNTFLNYLTVIALFALMALPSLVGHAHDRRIDRQLRRAERRAAETEAPVARYELTS
ncbi:hypothetical protein ACFYVL_13985 [Streptomyces sp. NPDC004111]|uniref:hypothetical protein n=1 Tax=Streptomyces sp. NPDC004111 TaxID=3364690 RepID=UPI003687D3A4